MGLLAWNTDLRFSESADCQLVGLASGPELLDPLLGLPHGGDECRPTGRAEDCYDLAAALFERKADRDLSRPVDVNNENDGRFAASAAGKKRAAINGYR